MELKWPNVFLFLFITSCAHQTENKDFFFSAKHYFEKGDWQDSLTLCDKALEVDSQNDDIYILRASNLSQLGKLTEAHQLLHHRISLKPHSSKLNLALIDWHRKYGSQTAAIEVGKKMIFREPKNLDAHRIIAELSIEHNDYVTAEASLSTLYQEDKSDESSAYKYGRLLLNLGKNEEAENAFNQVYQGKKYKVEAGKYLAWLNADRGNIKNANKFIRELSLNELNDPFTRKIVTRNLLNSPDVDRITLLTSYLREQKDDWGQHQLYLAYVDEGLQEKAMDLLAEIWNNSPDKYWAGINYAHHLKIVGDEKYAHNLLESISKQPINESDKNLIADLKIKWNSADSQKASRMIATSVKKYKVMRGDSVSEISQKFLGSSSRWKEIQKLNKRYVKDDGAVIEGSELHLPGYRP